MSREAAAEISQTQGVWLQRRNRIRPEETMELAHRKSCERFRRPFRTDNFLAANPATLWLANFRLSRWDEIPVPTVRHIFKNAAQWPAAPERSEAGNEDGTGFACRAVLSRRNQMKAEGGRRQGDLLRVGLQRFRS
jgi:hypothetical protein